MRKTQNFVIYFLILSFFFSSCSSSTRTTKVPVGKTRQVPIYKDVVEVVYSNLTNNPFNSYSRPVEVAVVKFNDVSSPYNGQVVADNLFKGLTKVYNIHEKFMLFPNSAIQSNLSALDLTNFDPSDKKALRKIYEELDIKFIIYGYLEHKNDLTFNLIIRKTEDGQVYINYQCKKSNNSDAIKDAVELIAHNKYPTYSTKSVFDYNKTEEYTDYEYREVKESDSGKTWATIIIVGLLVWAGAEASKKK